MLAGKSIIGFIPTVDKARARAFYEEILGLPFKEDDGYSIVFDANGIDIRLTPVGHYTPHKFTILGWAVDNIVDTVTSMRAKGVEFDKYEFLQQDELGIWTTPDGARVAWFKDVDGNLLSVSQDSE